MACLKRIFDHETGPWKGFCVAVSDNKPVQLRIASRIGSCPNNSEQQFLLGNVAALGVMANARSYVRGQHDPVFFDPTKVEELSALWIAIAHSPEDAVSKLQLVIRDASCTVGAANIQWQKHTDARQPCIPASMHNGRVLRFCDRDWFRYCWAIVCRCPLFDVPENTAVRFCQMVE